MYEVSEQFLSQPSDTKYEKDLKIIKSEVLIVSEVQLHYPDENLSLAVICLWNETKAEVIFEK